MGRIFLIIRFAAAFDVAKIKGVTFIDNHITVMQPEASAAAIAEGIARAFARNAELKEEQL